MGQHKHNPTAIAAAKGELPPKPKKMGKREADRLFYAKCQEILYGRLVKAIVKAQKENEPW
jgi:hypothetical protein